MADSVLTKSQAKGYGPRNCPGYGPGASIVATVRFDDECGNGHNTFAITGTVRVPGQGVVAGGCLHDEIAKVFPELAPFIRWHLCSTDGPMHYLANTVHLASDRDCWGRRAGDPSAWDLVVRWQGFPLDWKPHNCSDFMRWLQWASGADFELIRIDHDRERDKFGPKWTLGGAPDKWYQCPFDTEREGLQFLDAMRRGWEVVRVPTAFSTGKARDLDGARRAAVWPDATDEELTAPGLKGRLEARLPGLLAEFRRDVESLGFTW